MTKINPQYFEGVNHMMKDYHRSLPSILVDLDQLDHNIALTTNGLGDLDLRLVVKSIPSPELISYIIDKTNSKRLMVFHQPFLTDLTSMLDDEADVLIGKPMPVKTALYYYDSLPTQANGFNPYSQIQWLCDTVDRVEQYINLAKLLKQKLRLNIEIDIGLHRGGSSNKDHLRKALTLISENLDHVVFSGFMGYDPHVVKLPKIIKSQEKAFKESNDIYLSYKDVVKNEFPLLWNETLTFNGGGSPTLKLHKEKDTAINDVASGSCFVMPTTFDIPTLKDYNPACFIATPVLKKFEGTTIPGLEIAKSVLNVNSNYHQSFFIYGGFWKADYYYPKLKANTLYGESTNQTMVNGDDDVQLEVDDFVFLRPHQSEFVFLHFGEIIAFRSNKIVENWSLLQNV